MSNYEVKFKCPYCGKATIIEAAVEREYNIYQGNPGDEPLAPIVSIDLVPRRYTILCSNCDRLLLCDLTCKLLIS